MVKVFIVFLIIVFIKDNFQIIVFVEMVNYKLIMEYIKVNLKIIYLMVRENLLIEMEIFMKEIGKTVKNKDMEYLEVYQDIGIKDNIMMIKEMVMESIIGLKYKHFIKVILKMVIYQKVSIKRKLIKIIDYS